MPHPLDGVRAKVDRAEQHVRALDREIKRLFQKRKKPPAFTVRQEFYVQNQMLRVVIADVDELSPKLATIIGDAVHNLRSALDQLVFELAFVDNGGSEAGIDKTGFPTSSTIENFRDSHVQGRLLKGLTKTHRAMFKQFQPYRLRMVDRPRHVLTLLDDLSNDDKHRLLQPVFMSPQGFTIEFSNGANGRDCHFPGDTIEFQATNFIGRPLQPDTEIFRARIVVTGPNPDMPMKCLSQMAVGLRNGVVVIDTLVTTVAYVRRIIATFAPEFETRKALRVRDMPRYGRILPSRRVAKLRLAFLAEDSRTGVVKPLTVTLTPGGQLPTLPP